MEANFFIRTSDLKNKLCFLFSVLLYRCCLDLIYRLCISPFFDYSNFTYEPNTALVIYSWIILIVAVLFILPYFKNFDSVLSIAGVLLFFIRFIPFTSFIACKSQPIHFVLCECVFWVLIFSLLNSKIRIRLPKLPHSNAVLTCVALMLLLTVVFVSGYYAHFRLNFSLLNVYDLRYEAREFNMPTILAYLWAPAANVLPIMLIYFLQKKNRLFVCLIAFSIFLNFSINGSKSVLFKMLFCFFLYAFMKKDLLYKVQYLFLTLAIFALLEWLFYQSNVISTLIVRRVLFVPVLLDSLFYDYIYQTGPLYYGDDAAYINFVIGEEYFSNSEMNANNGLFTDAYVNLGELGCVIYPLFYAFFLKMCDAAFRGKNRQITFFAVLLIVTTLGSSTFTTSFLTHGIFLLFFVVYLLPKERNLKQGILSKI